MICPPITKDNRKKINKNRIIKNSPTIEEKPNISITNNTLFNCSMCYAKGCCRGLCPPMEWIVAQVEVEPARESPTIDPISITDTLKSMPWAANLSTSQNIAIMFFFEEFSQAGIAKKLKLSRQYVNTVIKEYRNKIVPNRKKEVAIRL